MEEIKALIEKYEERIKVINYGSETGAYGWTGNDLPGNLQGEYDTLRVVISDLKQLLK